MMHRTLVCAISVLRDLFNGIRACALCRRSLNEVGLRTNKDEPALGSEARGTLMRLRLESLNPTRLGRHGLDQNHILAAHHATHATTLGTGTRRLGRIGVSATVDYCRGSTVV